MQDPEYYTYVLCQTCRTLVHMNILTFCNNCQLEISMYTQAFSMRKYNVPKHIIKGREAIAISELTPNEIAQIVRCV